jgi:Tol biopolymer transport system component
MCVANDRFTSRRIRSDTMQLLSVFISATLALAGVLCAGPAAEEARFISNPRQLIYEGKRSGEGYFSNDGKRLIFQSEREEGNSFYQIYLLDLETGDVRRVSSGVGKTTCGFLRPDGKAAIFASTHLDPQAMEKQRRELEFHASGKQRRYSWDYDESMDIFATEVDGGPMRRLTDARGYDAEGSFSPDGRQITFTSLREAFPLEKLSAADRKQYEVDPAHFGEIYLMNADGSDQRRLTHAPGYDGGSFFLPMANESSGGVSMQ